VEQISLTNNTIPNVKVKTQKFDLSSWQKVDYKRKNKNHIMSNPTSPTAGLSIQKQPKLDSSSNFERNPEASIHTSNISDSDSIFTIQSVTVAHFTSSPSSNVEMV